MSLGGLITTKLDKKKLDRETTFIQHEDSAGILLIGVNHIYAQISVSREQEWNSNNDKVPEGINNVIDVEESEWVTYMQELRLNYYN